LALIALAAWPAPAVAQSEEERDFVPGEKAVFYDDYSDTVKGAAPSHWKVRGGTVKQCPDGSCLFLKGEGKLYPNLTAMPKNFTIETELRHVYHIPYGAVVWKFQNPQDATSWSVSYGFDPGGDDPNLVVVSALDGQTALGEAKVKVDWSKPVMLALWFQDNRLRAYVNRERAIDVNQLELKPWKTPIIDYNFAHAEEPVSLGTVRIAESTPDISQVLLSSGKYVSHAIQFDVNSAELRPESQNILKQIAEALQKNPALRLRVEGHTDSTGDAAKNLELSKLRAQSVQKALAAMGIADGRLTAEGYGQTKPIASNDTNQGRAENRRVEFIRF
jgi:OOP family OmpA-OmpF porin